MANSNQCYMCKHFDRFYTMGIKQFNKAKCGWCMERRGIAYIHESCDKYIRKPHKKRSKSMLNITLSNLLTEISEIRKLIDAEQGEFDDE